MAEIISHAKFKKKQEEQQRVEQQRVERQREHASRIARESDEIAQEIQRHSKIPAADRNVFACNMHLMLRQLEQKDRHSVAEVFQEGIGATKEESTKRRGRFARAKNDLKTPLAANGKQWVNLARAVGRILNGESRAILALVQGSSFVRSNAPLLSTSDLREESAKTAEYLEEIATWVIRRNNLVSYFETLTHGSYSINAGGVFFPDRWVFSADPTQLVEDDYLYDEPYILPAIPKVPLYTENIPIPARGTKSSVGQLNDDPNIWEALAMKDGYEEFDVTIQSSLSLGICPLDNSARPLAVFINEARSLELPVWGQIVKTNGNTRRAGDWILFPHSAGNTEEWSAVTFCPQTHLQHQAVKAFEKFALFRVSPATCLRFLATYCYEIDVHFDDIEFTTGEELEEHVTAAPSRTVLAALQRNLAYKDDKYKISSKLDENAAKLARVLELRREEECEKFSSTMAQIRERWRKSDTEG